MISFVNVLRECCTFSLDNNIEGAVHDVVQAKIGILLLFPLRIGVRAQKQRLVLPAVQAKRVDRWSPCVRLSV